MDKIWYRNPSKSEVIGRCGRDEKNEWSRRTDKSWMLKKKRRAPPTGALYARWKYLKKGHNSVHKNLLRDGRTACAIT